MSTTIGLMILETLQTKSLSAGLQYVAISATTAQIAMGALIAVVSIGALAWNAYTANQEKIKQASIDNAKSIQQESESIKSAIDLIKDEKTSREQIISAVNNVNTAYSNELKAIENVNDLRQKAIDLLDEEAIKKAKQYTSENLSGYKSALSDKSKVGSIPMGYSADDVAERMVVNDEYQQTLPQSLKFNIETTPDEQIKQLEKITDTIQKTSGYVETYGGLLSYAEGKLSSLREEQVNTDSVISSFNDMLAIQGKRWDETSNSVVNMTDKQIEEYNAQQALNSATEDGTIVTEENTDANEDNADSTQVQIDAHQALMDSTNDYLSSMDLVNGAMQEQSENGELSADTTMKLIENGYAGALAYNEEANAMTLDAEAVNQLAIAKMETVKAGLLLANNNLSGVILEEGRAAALAAQEFNYLAMSKHSAAVADATNKYQDNQKQLDLINLELKNLQENGAKGFEAVGKSAGGASKSVQTLEDKVKSAVNYMKSMIDKEIKALREAKEAEEERVEAEIDALKERREAQEAYWDAKIEKVKKANEILEEQNKLQELEQNLALAKSKKVKVFTGEGFEYKEDVDAVSKASQELSDYKREQQIAKEVERLEELKKKALANIDKQIKGWEEYKKEMQKNFDAQIKALENYKDQLDDLTNGYKEQQDKLIAEQLLGAKLEQGNWQLRIDNLKKFVKEYNGELSGINTDIDTKGTEKSTEGSKAGMPSNIPKHASGSYAVPTDEIAIVGDSPNRELSIGSKLNMGGVMARLKGGTGIMPNTLTERLVNMAYNTNTSPTNNSNSSVININVDKIELPSVTNGRALVNELMGLKTLAIQTSS